ncbi:MAG: SIMPL domain-containing protein [Pseudonocardiales bacterium]|nr:MAG: SIMPL domain-containing protein [Pseudonocardiales bacterium]
MAEQATSTVTVTGRGQASGDPDVVIARLGVDAVGESVEVLATANAALADVRAALAADGIPDSDLRTADMSLQSWKHRDSEPQQYQARMGLTVTIRDLPAAGEVVARAIRAAGRWARLDGLEYAVRDRDALVTAAREAAWADARAAAEHYARLAGCTLGAVAAVRESTDGMHHPIRQFSSRSAAAEPAGLSLAPGSENVDVAVVVEWVLEP